ncbi:hypothetical protein RQP46_000704 [Phenoliferia psychrophenolica]
MELAPSSQHGFSKAFKATDGFQDGFQVFRIQGYQHSTNNADDSPTTGPPSPRTVRPAPREKRDIRKTWTEAEDSLLVSLVQARTGAGASAYDWAGWADRFDDRNTKGLKARWVNSLRSRVGLDTHLPPWTLEEDAQLQDLVPRGTRAVVDWDTIASGFANRTSTAVSGRWDVIGHVERRKAKRPDHLAKGEWSGAEDAQLIELVNMRSMGNGWHDISTNFPGRSKGSVKQRFSMLQRSQRPVGAFERLPFKGIQAPALQPVPQMGHATPTASCFAAPRPAPTPDENTRIQAHYDIPTQVSGNNYDHRPVYQQVEATSYLQDARLMQPQQRQTSAVLPSLASALSFASTSNHAFHPLSASSAHPLAIYSDPRPVVYHHPTPAPAAATFAAPSPAALSHSRFPSVFAPSTFENTPLPDMFRAKSFKSGPTVQAGPRPILSPLKRVVNR